jgi:hypothetical protein
VTVQHEHEFEAAPGLPEKLPANEHILWQGAPDWWQLAVHALHVRKLAFYFAGMMAVQAVFLLADGQPLVASLALSGGLATVALGLLALTAWMSARTSLYTLTNRRVVMRVGIVLTLTFNLPLRQIAGASFKAQGVDCGDIALALKGSDRIAWVHLWPHARPWALRRPEPTLRCVPGAQALGALIERTWKEANPGVSLAVNAQDTAPASVSHHHPAAV